MDEVGHKSVTPVLDLLVQNLFDYSGMFPPEQKSFQDALSDSAKFPETLRRSSIVNADIVLSFNTLKEINESVLKQCKFDRTCRIAVLGNSPEAETEIAELIKFSQAGKTSCVPYTVISYEIKGVSNLAESLKILPHEIVLAVEPDLSVASEREDLKGIADQINPVRHRISLKIRGTGQTAVTNEKIVAVLRVAADKKLHLKATGGLHHPILEDRYKNNLGFLNVTIAILLARKYFDEISDTELLTCLGTANASEFIFTDDSVSWMRFELSYKEIYESKSQYRFSIGSCSLKEPDEDLCRLFGPV